VGRKGYAVGLDINKTAVDYAQKSIKRLDLPNDALANVAFFNLNVYFLDKKLKFDRIIISAVCPRNMVMHILGQMKDGGICVLIVRAYTIAISFKWVLSLLFA
jgi:protein-L-isoaspartate O-methyltransferase